jgi:hypothetical protein
VGALQGQVGRQVVAVVALLTIRAIVKVRAKSRA